MRSYLALLAALALAAGACRDATAPRTDLPARPPAVADGALTLRLYHPDREGAWLVRESAPGAIQALHGDVDDIFEEVDAFYVSEMAAAPGSARARAAERERARVRALRGALRAGGNGRVVYAAQQLGHGARLLSVRVNDRLLRETVVPGSLAGKSLGGALAARTDCAALEWFIDEYILPEACDVGETEAIQAELAALDAAAASMLSALPASEPEWAPECEGPNSTARFTPDAPRAGARPERAPQPGPARTRETVVARSSDDECLTAQRTSSGPPSVGAASADEVPLVPWRVPARCREAYWEATGAAGAFLVASGMVGVYIGAKKPLRAWKTAGVALAAYAVAGAKISKYQYCISNA